MSKCQSGHTPRLNSWFFTICNFYFLFFTLNSNFQLFADDTSLFSVVHNITDSVNLLNNDLSKINKWALQWKMSCNPDPTKQTQEVIFDRKPSKRNHPGRTFNNTILNLTTIYKHFGFDILFEVQL